MSLTLTVTLLIWFSSALGAATVFLTKDVHPSTPFGALAMEKNREWFGNVGTGFTDQDRRDILEFLKENKGP